MLKNINQIRSNLPCGWIFLTCFSSKKNAAHIPVTKTAAFAGTLRNLHLDGVVARFQIAQRDINGIGKCAGAPVASAEV